MCNLKLIYYHVRVILWNNTENFAPEYIFGHNAMSTTMPDMIINKVLQRKAAFKKFTQLVPDAHLYTVKGVKGVNGGRDY